MAQLKLNTEQKPEGQASELLSRLSLYAREHNILNRKLAEELTIPYNTLRGWQFFTQKKKMREPSEQNLVLIEEFLLRKEKPEIYAKVEEARRRAEKIKYLLLLLEDELRWFKNGDVRIRDEYRKGLNGSDIGYVSSLLTMLTEEDKFARWLALTTIQFNSFKRR